MSATFTPMRRLLVQPENLGMFEYVKGDKNDAVLKAAKLAAQLTGRPRKELYERELGRLYFDDGETSLELNGQDHKTLVKLYKKMIDDEDAGHQVLQLVTDIDGDQDYEIVIISAHDLDADDLILTAFHLPGQVEGLVA